MENKILALEGMIHMAHMISNHKNQVSRYEKQLEKECCLMSSFYIIASIKKSEHHLNRTSALYEHLKNYC